jgi:hypothetical protein
MIDPAMAKALASQARVAQGVEADELAQLLQRAKLPAPYIVVGRSYAACIDRQAPETVQKHDTASWLDVNALIQSGVFLLPTPLTHEKPP